MELTYSWVVGVGIALVIILAVFVRNKKDVYKEGKKVANTELIEQTELYKRLKKQYKLISTTAFIFLLLGIACGFVLVSRPAKVEQINQEIRNRDIFICLDISSSVDQQNLKLCKEIKNVVKELDGERIGITIFNCSSVLLVPLTDDYEYIQDTLDKLLESIETSIALEESGYENWTEEDLRNYDYKYEGTLEGDRGSSLIGDGLATCMYNFPDLETNKERSRIIIFSTDNDLQGEPLVTVEEAAALCKKNDIKVFGLAAEGIVDEKIFKNSVESTGGKYYNIASGDKYSDLVKGIEQVKTSEMNKIETIRYDQPQLIFILMMVFLGIYFVLSRKAKL